MDIKLDQEQMTAVVSAAIMKSIDDDQRNVLIQGAIKHLLTIPPSSNSYGQQRTSPLTDAFNDATGRVAREIATEMLSSNEDMKSKIKDLITEAFEKVFTESREKTVSKIAEAIVAGMHSEKY